VTAITQPSFGAEYGDDLTLDPDVAAEAETHEVTLRIHYGLAPGEPVLVDDEWLQRLNLAGVFAYDVVVVDDHRVKRHARFDLADAIDDADEPDVDG
jgi:hypothetical protein